MHIYIYESKCLCATRGLGKVVGPRLSTGVSAVVLQFLTVSGAEREGFRCQHGAEKVSRTTNVKPIGCQSEPRNLQTQLLGNMVEQERKKEHHPTKVWTIFWIIMQNRPCEYFKLI